MHYWLNEILNLDHSEVNTLLVIKEDIVNIKDNRNLYTYHLP